MPKDAKPADLTSLEGEQLLSAFLAELYPEPGKVWMTGFPDISQASWHGGFGLDRLRGRIASLDEADLYFCIGELRDGATRRNIGDVKAQRLLIADDIGSKVDRDKWSVLSAVGMPAPTFRIETSPGNETWGWLLDGDATSPDRFEELALIRAHMVDRKLTDNVMDECRYIRLPWGWNSKGKYRVDGAGLDASPRVRLLEWNPGAVDIDRIGSVIVPGGVNWRQATMPAAGMTGAQLGAAIGAGALNRTADLRNPEPLIRLAEAIGLNPRQVRPGVVEADCPNMAQHSDRADTGFAFLGGGLCQCQHASCQHLRSGDFRHLMEEEYDRRVAGRIALGMLPDDMPASAQVFMARADFSQQGVDFKPDSKDTNAAAAEAEDLAARQKARDEKRAEDAEAAQRRLAERFVWVVTAMGFFDTEGRRLLSKEQFDNHPDVLPHFPVGETGKKRASNVMLNRTDVRFAFGMTYRPGTTDAVVLDEDENGQRCEHVNLWTPSRVGRRQGTPKAWLELIEHVLPDREYREWFLDRLAFHLQRPGVRSPIIPVVNGGQGVGKDMMLVPFVAIIGAHNVQTVSMQRLNSEFNEWQRAAVVILPELKLSADGKLYNALKDWTGAGNTRLTINEKYQRPYSIRPVANFFAFTNHMDAIRGMEADDRRMAVYVSPAEKKPRAWYDQKAVDVADPAEIERVHDFLLTRDLSNFNPHAPAPDPNGSKRAMYLDTLSSVAAWVYEECQPGGRFAGRAFLTVQEVELAATGAANRTVANTVTTRAIRDGLVAAGCASTERRVRDGRERRRFWFGPAASDDLRAKAAGWSPQQIVEAARKDAEDAAREAAAKAAKDLGVPD